MAVNLTCTQVGALLSFYIEDKLSQQLKEFVDAHLANCPLCRSKLETLTNMVSSMRDAQEKITALKTTGDSEQVASQQNNKMIDELRLNLSAYVDNELDDTENIKVKKYIISNQKARQEVENMYNLKKIMNNAFEKTKNESKDDFSKYIMSRIDIQEEVYAPDSFAKVVAIFVTIIIAISVTAIAIFWV